jgi:hypothetical protein
LLFVANRLPINRDQCVLKISLSDRLKAIGVRVKKVTRRGFCDILRGAATALSSISRLILDTSSPIERNRCCITSGTQKRASRFFRQSQKSVRDFGKEEHSPKDPAPQVKRLACKHQGLLYDHS